MTALLVGRHGCAQLPELVVGRGPFEPEEGRAEDGHLEVKGVTV